MEKVGDIHGVKIYVLGDFEMVMDQPTFDAFRAFVESITPVMLPIAAQNITEAGSAQAHNTQSDEIAAIRKRLSDMESAFHDFVMLHEPVEGFDSMRI
jgi:hypothetical protein